ncbi:uncharacterized protein LOC119075465 [Bradysia coprophila]|uniref:uncharacterized protein LOC119075465 n=1 Tax=Bradysia coprophila TaxID=38358 RepID=UPI00187DA319|nr:uncharacterized protein LOC119075465 [Bradysia coprophila]
MKFLIFLAIFGLALLTVDAANSKRKEVSYSIRSTWLSYRKQDQCSCMCNEQWQEGVQDYHDGCERATSQYEGDANPLAAVVMDSFREFLTIVMESANSNSTILSSSGKSMLKSMSKCKKLDRSSMVILTEFEKVFPLVANDLRIVALRLSNHIGHLAKSFTDSVQELSCVFSQYMRDLLSSCRLTGCKKKVDLEPSLKKLQNLMNLVALISETLLKDCNPSIEAQQSVLVLSVIFWWFQIVVQGINTATMDILGRRDCEVSQNIKSLSLSFDFVLVSITQAISGVVASFVKNIKGFLSMFVNITLALNTAIKDIFGVFNGVTVTVAEIARNLFKSLEITSATGRTNIVKGVRGSN